MDMVISAGKSRKNVDAYVLLPPDAKSAIDLLNTLRKDVGVPATNVYIFARLGSDSPMTGNTDLREIVDSCPGLQFPERISSTTLRKYIATVSQVCMHFCVSYKGWLAYTCTLLASLHLSFLHVHCI